MIENDSYNLLKEECRRAAKTVSGIQNGQDLKQELQNSLALILRAIRTLHESSAIDGVNIVKIAERPPTKKRNKKIK